MAVTGTGKAANGSQDKSPPVSPPAPTSAPLAPSQFAEQEARASSSVDRTHIIAGFARAISTTQGGVVPANWMDAEASAKVLAERVPRLTVARLLVWARDHGQDLSVVAARVLTDALTTEPGLMELSPEEAAEEGMALIQQMWPQGAFVRKDPDAEREKEREIANHNHPILQELRKLGAQWKRLRVLPIDQAKLRNPTLWRRKLLNDIAIAKAQGQEQGLSRTQMVSALEESGDRWSWEIPAPAKQYVLDEFGQAPEGMDLPVVPVRG